ncbi:TAXI family TRAP transporter solute-binding subunit [Nocardia abscessus]|uniref:TAXI family TRAP transporter solute-binding subunit n=1 Tax=Nocardia TaxID=1817 RepID=UPI001895EAB9|nr:MULTISPECIES: TAXI family TRAP transporter solute-binding subunit [Nocardia]MBF6219852.1 TAXI family TRAP transporter solute-binding subunit [Nocardia abscessus]MDE1671761.1 TAXI family TRAP transporter solute-binding subunit [Nocardia gipuzkoensis]
MTGRESIVRRGIGRRGFLALAAAAGIVGCAPNGRGATVRLASGEVGGFYYAFAGLLGLAAEHIGDVRIDRVTTSGSQDNLSLLARGEVDAALTLADSLPENPGRVSALGRVYENYLQLVVRADSPIGSVADLRGTRVSLGAEGSGAALTGERILRVAGLDPAVDVAVSHRPLAEAVAALTAGEADALLWAGGVPTALLAVPSRMRLVDMGELAAPMREWFGPVYDRVAIPADAYPGGASVLTIGVANLLLAAETMPDDVAASIVELLVRHADALVPSEAAGTQFLDGRSLISTGAIPLHPGAAAVYRRWHG